MNQHEVIVFEIVIILFSIPSVEGEQEGTESNLSDEIPASVLYSSEFCNLYVASTKISPKPIYIGVRSQHTDM